MADSKISNLASYTTPQSADVLAIVDTANSVTKKITYTDLLAGTVGTGTVTSVSVASANGFAGSVATATTTPAITLSTSITGILKGNGTAVSAATVDVDYTTPTGTETLTNKRIQPRIVTAASYTTDTGTSLSFATCNLFIVTAQAGALKFNNPGGSPVDGEKMMIRVKDNGSARALTYDTQFRASSDLALPSITVLSKTLYLGFQWNAADTKMDLLAVLNNF